MFSSKKCFSHPSLWEISGCTPGGLWTFPKLKMNHFPLFCCASQQGPILWCCLRPAGQAVPTWTFVLHSGHDTLIKGLYFTYKNTSIIQIQHSFTFASAKSELNEKGGRDDRPFKIFISLSTLTWIVTYELFNCIGGATVAFLISSLFLFVDIDHQNEMKNELKVRTVNPTLWKFQKGDQKWVKHIFWHPGSLELHISLQTLLYLITFPILSISLKSPLSLK